MELPSVHDAIIRRPGSYASKANHWIPNPDYAEFWEHWYETLRRNFDLTPPVQSTIDDVDPLFGHFGMRYHPVIHKAEYFHGGMDIVAQPKTLVFPIAPGILEYAGYGIVNGNYVMISHPDIVTDDGYVLVTSVMHLKENLVGFSSYQKMLREISMHHYPRIAIKQEHPIGIIGNTGSLNSYHRHVHVQCELRNKKTNEIILLNPASVLGFEARDNVSKTVANQNEFQMLEQSQDEAIKRYGMQCYWRQ